MNLKKKLTPENKIAIKRKKRTKFIITLLMISVFLVILSQVVMVFQWLCPLIEKKCLLHNGKIDFYTFHLPSWFNSAYLSIPSIGITILLVCVLLISLILIFVALILTSTLNKNDKYLTVKFEGMPIFTRVNSPKETWTDDKLKVKLPDGATHTMKPTDKGTFVLMEDWSIKIKSNGKKINIVIPKHFKTDFASIPQCLHGLINPLTNNIYAAVLHDYLYRSPNDNVANNVSKSKSDALLYFGMRAKGVSRLMAATIFLGVYLGGKSSYKRNYNIDYLQ